MKSSRAAWHCRWPKDILRDGPDRDAMLVGHPGSLSHFNGDEKNPFMQHVIELPAFSYARLLAVAANRSASVLRSRSAMIFITCKAKFGVC